MPDNKMLVQELETQKYWVFDLGEDNACPEGYAREETITAGGNTSQTYFFDQYNIPEEGVCEQICGDLNEQGWTLQS